MKCNLNSQCLVMKRSTFMVLNRSIVSKGILLIFNNKIIIVSLRDKTINYEMKGKVVDLLNEMSKSEEQLSLYDMWKERNLVEGKLLKDVMKSYFYIYRILYKFIFLFIILNRNV